MGQICSYCSNWIKSHVVKRLTNNPEDNNPKSKEDKRFKRRCAITKKLIEASSKGCRYFSPSGFYCDHLGHYIKLIQCLNRRRNTEKYKDWEACKKCRQFEHEVREIAIDYFIDAKRPINPLARKIKRRNKSKKRIKRRSKTNTPIIIEQPKKRRIKRRDNAKKKDAVFKKLVKRKCKYPKCYYYSKKAKDYCCNACYSDHKDYKRLYGNSSKRKIKRRKP